MRFLIRYIIPLFFAQVFLGQNFVATVSKKSVNEGERISVSFNLDSRGANFTPPSFEGFKVVSGPNPSQSMEIMNGRMSARYSWSYLLIPVKTGTLTIGTASVKASNGVLKSKPIQLNVKKLTAAEKKRQSRQYLFLKTVVSKGSLYQGEPLVATYKLYTRVNINDYGITKEPEFNGFWNKEFEIKQNNRSSEVIDGKQWTVFTLKKKLLYPQKSGDLVIDPMKMEFVIEKPSNRRRSLFERPEMININTSSDPIKIKVKSLPSGAPKSFSGAVGQFNLSSKVSKNELKANDGVDYSIVISGRGNLQLLPKPDLDFPQDFEVYDPKIDNKYSVKLSGASGKKQFNYLVIPRFGGEFTLKPFEFSYFDPKQKKYVTLKSEAHQLKVEKGAQDEAVTFKGGVNKSEVKNLNSDIRYIKTSTDFSKKSGIWLGSLGYYLTLLVGPLLVFLAFLWKRKELGERADVVGTKRKKANKNASKYLKEAEASINDDSQFYSNLGKALNGYLSDKLNLPLSALTLDEVKSRLTAANVETATVDQLSSTLENCEMAKYAPMQGVSKEQMLADATSIINQIESVLK